MFLLERCPHFRGCVVSSHVIRDIFRTHFKFTYVIRIIRVQKNSVVENGVAYS